ncbi:hypothetical protein, partial [Nonomuraea turkmeniaca]|uniref:hypothetical protein n=1 Tax=Nonomuraea turkmeniaca TaxID=103838 RepID=UPI001476B917
PDVGGAVGPRHVPVLDHHVGVRRRRGRQERVDLRPDPVELLVWIAAAVPAAIVVGVVVWWLRRDPVGGDAGGGFEAERTWDWELSLTPEAEAAFMEGLRAYHDAGNALRLVGEHGVLTTYGPPRLISLHLLADGFAALGDAAMHDPHGTVAAMMARFAAAERPGVLHLRPEWPAGEVDGMDQAAFADAVRAIVCPPGTKGVHDLGALRVTVTGEQAAGAVGTCQTNTMLLDLARVLDLYQEAREKQPGVAADELLREVLSGVIAAGGPGLTWVRPPTPEERRIVTR